MRFFFECVKQALVSLGSLNFGGSSSRSSRLSATDHVNNLLTSCSSLLYVMRVIRGHGISTESLRDVFRATILTKIT